MCSGKQKQLPSSRVAMTQSLSQGMCWEGGQYSTCVKYSNTQTQEWRTKLHRPTQDSNTLAAPGWTLPACFLKSTWDKQTSIITIKLQNTLIHSFSRFVVDTLTLVDSRYCRYCTTWHGHWMNHYTMLNESLEWTVSKESLGWIHILTTSSPLTLNKAEAEAEPTPSATPVIESLWKPSP